MEVPDAWVANDEGYRNRRARDIGDVSLDDDEMLRRRLTGGDARP